MPQNSKTYRDGPNPSCLDRTLAIHAFEQPPIFLRPERLARALPSRPTKKHNSMAWAHPVCTKRWFGLVPRDASKQTQTRTTTFSPPPITKERLMWLSGSPTKGDLSIWQSQIKDREPHKLETWSNQRVSLRHSGCQHRGENLLRMFCPCLQ